MLFCVAVVAFTLSKIVFIKEIGIGTAVAVLLAILMMMYRRKPLVWHAYHVAAWITALGVIVNLAQLI